MQQNAQTRSEKRSIQTALDHNAAARIGALSAKPAHRYGKPCAAEHGKEHVDRHDQLIKPHAFRADAALQHHAVGHAHAAQQHGGERQLQKTVNESASVQCQHLP